MISLGLLIIGLVLIASMIYGRFLIGTMVLAVPGILFLMVGSPVRILAVIFGLQIILTIVQLSFAGLYIGFINLRIDDLLSIWLVFLWVLSLPDRSMRGIKIGVQGYLILIFLLLLAVAAFRGFSSAHEPTHIGIHLKTYGAYLLYFPLLWVLSDDKSRNSIWRILLTSAVISGLVYMIKGLTGSGEGVCFRKTTGLRIATRQPNAIGVVLMMFVGKLWKTWKNHPPLVLIVPSIILMGGALILSQTRGIWGGVLLALAAAWILNLFRKSDRVPFGRKFIVSLTILATFVILVVFSLSLSGILSAADIAQRTESESGNYFADTAVLSRIMAWSAVMDKLKGSHLIMGRGIGATITFFSPDTGEMQTQFHVDSSYFQTALNMGAVGVVTLLAIFLTSLFRAAGLFLRTADRQRAGTALGIFCAIIMLLFASGFAAVLVNYRFTILWIFLPAYLQIEINKENETAMLQSEQHV